MSKEVVTDVFRDKAKVKNKRIYLSLPLPVSVNKLYIQTRGGKRLTRAAENYTLRARARINQHIEEQRWECVENKVWLYIDCVFYFPDRKIRDASNMLKLLLDVMQGYIYRNDYIALPRIQSVEYDKDDPRVEVCISVQDKLQRDKGILSTKIKQ